MSVFSRIVITLLIIAIPLVLVLLFAYDWIVVDFGSFMEDQGSNMYAEPPRLQPPDLAWPVERPDYLANVTADKNPVPADAVSYQRGSLLFSFNCVVCHGALGRGDGPVTRFWDPSVRRPANLAEARFRNYPDGLFYQVISNGIGTMPPMRENLSERQRWDVINHVRTLSAQ